MRFPQITWMAKGLSINTLGDASVHDGNNMIEIEALSAFAPRAFARGPFLPLKGRKLKAVPPFSGLFVEMMVNAPRQLRNHLVTIIGPSGNKRGSDFLARFRGVFEALRRTGFLLGRICTPASANFLARGLVMCLAPVGIVFAAHGGALAFGLPAGFADAAFDERFTAVKKLSANDAGEFLTVSVWHGSEVSYWVNSVDHPKVSVQDFGVNTEPSRACNAIGARGTEGVTTRGCGNNNPPTSAQRESEDIVWAAWQHAEVGHKQVDDNISDDVLNISPSVVFTAAQYSIAQAAVAVSISGLEELQNSGKERMIDLLEARIKNAERTFQNNLSNDAYSNGTASGGKQINGLQALVADTPTSGTVGGIDRSQWGFWQNQSWSFATAGLTAGATTIQTMMNRAYLSVRRQSDRPDLIVCDNTYYRYYLESMQAIQRVASEDDAMAGFGALRYMTADVVYDGGFEGLTGLSQGTSQGAPNTTWYSGSGAPSNHMYILNTEYIFLRPHKDRNMVPLEPDRFSVNQDAMVKLVAWAGNMAMSNAFVQAVITA